MLKAKRCWLGIAINCAVPILFFGVLAQLHYLVAGSPIQSFEDFLIQRGLEEHSLLDTVSPKEFFLIWANDLILTAVLFGFLVPPLELLKQLNISQPQNIQEIAGKAVAVLSPAIASFWLCYVVAAIAIKSASSLAVFNSFISSPTIAKVFVLVPAIGVLSMVVSIILVRRRVISIRHLRIVLYGVWVFLLFVSARMQG